MASLTRMVKGVLRPHARPDITPMARPHESEPHGPAGRTDAQDPKSVPARPDDGVREDLPARTDRRTRTVVVPGRRTRPVRRDSPRTAGDRQAESAYLAGLRQIRALGLDPDLEQGAARDLGRRYVDQFGPDRLEVLRQEWLRSNP